MQAIKAKLVPQGLLGTGMAQQAAQMMNSRPYQLHVQEALALGETPMTREQFEVQAKRTY